MKFKIMYADESIPSLELYENKFTLPIEWNSKVIALYDKKRDERGYHTKSDLIGIWCEAAADIGISYFIQQINKNAVVARCSLIDLSD